MQPKSLDSCVIALSRLPVLALALGLAACTAQPGTGGQDSGPAATACTIKTDCPTGQVCAGGVCIQGDCEVREDCPRSRDQVCDEFFRCRPDPDSPIRDECPNGDRDCNLGEFCSAGSCYSTSDRTACTRTSQCGPADRCDTRAGYCVPNFGGCDRCNEYPELCCTPDEACDPESKRCRPVSQGTTCTVATQETDCRPGERCVDARCVQCVMDSDCGPGTTCNPAIGRCVSSGSCGSDEDCRTYPGRRCAPATGQCVVPQCSGDGDCTGNEACNTDTFQCFLPPATCTETDEPNNAPAQATQLTMMTAGGGYSGTTKLCRGDQDFIGFPLQGGRRVEVSVTVSPSSSAYGIGLSLLNGANQVLSQTTLGFSSGTRRISANVAEDGTGFLRITSGTSTTENQWNVSIEVSYLEPLMCDSEPGEPNDSLATALNSTVMGNFTRALCTPTDVDYHLLRAPANKKVSVTIDHDPDAELNLELQSTSGTTLASSFFGTPPRVLTTRTGNADTDLILMVEHDSFAEPAGPVIYTGTITVEELPSCALDAMYENNDTRASASVVTPGVISAVACEQMDRDWYKITLAQRSLVRGTLAFPSGMDMDLKLWGTSTTTALDSATSGSANPEIVEMMNLDPGTYYLEVIPYTTSAASYPANYTLTIDAPGFCMDDALDNGMGNDTAGSAVGLRDFVSGPLNYTENLALCRGDEDWFRVVALGEERLNVLVTGPTGALVTVYASTATGLTELGRSRTVELQPGMPAEVFTAPITPAAGLFYVRVSGGPATEGAYSVTVITKVDPCDALGGDLEPNDAPANAVAVASGTNRGVFCPAADVDIWRVPSSAGDNLRVVLSFDGAEGDADVALWAPGQAMPLAQDIDADSAPGATAEVNHTVSSAGVYHVVVTRKGTLQPVGQTYDLDVTGFNPPMSSSSSGGSSGSSGTVSSGSSGGASSAGGSSSGAVSGGSSSLAGSSSVDGSSSGAVSAGSTSVDGSSSGGGASSTGASSSLAGSSSAEPSSSGNASSLPGSSSI